jgi:hypothetical protein
VLTAEAHSAGRSRAAVRAVERVRGGCGLGGSKFWDVPNRLWRDVHVLPQERARDAASAASSRRANRGRRGGDVFYPSWDSLRWKIARSRRRSFSR